MSRNINLEDEEILHMLEDDISDEDNLEFEVEEEEYDSDADPEYVPSENELSDDDIPGNIRLIENNVVEGQPKKKKRTERVLPGSNSNKALQKEKNPLPAVVGTSHENIDENEGPETLIFIPNIETMSGKDDFLWNTKFEEVQGKTPSKNIVHISPGPTPNARHASEPIECFRLFFTPQILHKIIIHTNEEITLKRANYKDPDHYSLSYVNVEEMEAYLGLLVLTAALKDNHLSIKLLFDPNYCGDRYRATMTERRFNFITDCLRFDDKASREERKKESKLAAINEIWETLIENCKLNYKPSAYVTIDEQLVGFRGKCPFRMYIPSKPNKYGIKIVMMCDNSTKYMINAIPYLGKGCVPAKTSVAEYFVEKLVAPTISGSNRNITMDNWFSSIPLAERLLEESKVTIVGTIKKNKRELPAEFKDPKYNNRNVGSSLFLFHNDITAVSYKAKANKTVTLISTMHPCPSVNEKSKKPEIIMTYNCTKGSVDTFDQMCQAMNCGRKTKRWPLCFFYNMLNIATINAYVIYVHNSYRAGKDSSDVMSRMNFMLSLHEKLTVGLQKSRLENRNIPSVLKKCIQNVLGVQERIVVPADQQGPRK